MTYNLKLEGKRKEKTLKRVILVPITVWRQVWSHVNDGFNGDKYSLYSEVVV